ncbi:MAG: SPOR domain-containing protein [Sphingomonadales bacterium]|nr:MAG: SPOR domain-containing protein [Sphingomonadales bacterium]
MISPGDERSDGNASGGEVELALSGDDSLPWLESDEYDPDEGEVDTSRIVGFALILLLLLAVTIGGVWWYTNRMTGTEILADGSTIEAPDGPYKERPENAGGKTFAGTGNVAPGVGEGVTREGQLAERPSPTPTVAAAGAAPRPMIATRSSDEEPVAQQGVGVQVGAYGSRSSAEAGWATLRRQTTLLNGVSYRIERGQADIGIVYRLQAVAGDLAAARELCEALKADGLACQVKR